MKGDFDFISQYWQECARYRNAIQDSDEELEKGLVAGDAVSREKIVQKNLLLVIKIAYEYRKSKVDFEDMVQAGNLGLLQSLDNFRTGENCKFQSYAAFYIRRNMIRLIRNSRHFLHVPQNAHLAAVRAVKATRDGNNFKFSNRKDGVRSLAEAQAILADAPLSLDILSPDSDNEGDTGSMYNRIVDDREKSRDYNLEMLNYILYNGEAITDNERDVIERLYGLGGKDKITRKQCAEIMSCSGWYVSVIERGALAKLKLALERAAN